MSFGQAISAAGADPGQLRLYDATGRFLGLGMGGAGGARASVAPVCDSGRRGIVTGCSA